eukprot:3790730-Heterocapsa_arctica.AAC.1
MAEASRQPMFCYDWGPMALGNLSRNGWRCTSSRAWPRRRGSQCSATTAAPWSCLARADFMIVPVASNPAS